MNTPAPSKSATNRLRWVALFALTGINLLNYIDRYIFSALLPAIKADLKFTDTELGILGSAFLLAYVFASPLFGLFGDRGGRSRLMAMGVSIWSVATAFSGITTTFMGQLITRATVGFGESAYSVIAPSTIADYFSKNTRGKVFSIYSGAIPIGSALGYVIGGWLEPRVGWQKSFFVVGIPGILLAVLLFFLPDPPRGGSEESIRNNNNHTDHETQAAGIAGLKKVYASLFTNGGFLCTVLGYAAYTFVVGGMAFWMPSYLVREFNVSLEKANLQFGMVTVVGGFFGVLIGGFFSDKMENRSGNGFLKMSVISMLLSVPLFWYVLGLKDYDQFMIALFALEVALFMCISPLDAAVISYVRPSWRATAMALNVFLIHVLGDGISRTLMGVVSDSSGLGAAIGILPWALIVAGVFWVIGILWFWQPVRWPSGRFELPKFQAHRGYRPKERGIVENTLPAFYLAAESGAEMTELDVHVTADGHAVVFHDHDLKRLGGGRSDRVDQLSAAQLAEYTGAPKLLDLLSDPRAPKLINIEVKTPHPWKGGGVEEATIKAIREAGAEDRVMLSSFNPFTLHRLACLAPDIPRGLIATDEIEPGNGFYLRHLLLGFWARPSVIHLDHRMITAERVERWNDRGIQVLAWTVNDANRAKELLQVGVRSIISDELFQESQLK